MSGLWVLTSFYINRAYIETNICINRFDKIPLCKGSCYLEKTLTENEKKQQEQPTLKMGQVVLFFENTCWDLLRLEAFTEDNRLLFTANNNQLLVGFTAGILKPPIYG